MCACASVFVHVCACVYHREGDPVWPASHPVPTLEGDSIFHLALSPPPPPGPQDPGFITLVEKFKNIQTP